MSGPFISYGIKGQPERGKKDEELDFPFPNR